MDKVLIEIRDMHKIYNPGENEVRALDHVSASFDSGKINALLGKNGSGKSTLCKIFAGAESATSGEFYLDGQKLSFRNPTDAAKSGIVLVYQETSLVPTLTVMENIFMGRLPKKPGGLINWKLVQSETERLLKVMDVRINPKSKIMHLPMWQRQVVEICKALSQDPKVLILDEPTSALAKAEVEKLFAAIRKVKENDVIIIYISHKLAEIHEIADTVTVLRDAQYVGKKNIEEIDNAGMIAMMFGKTEIRKRPADVVATAVWNTAAPGTAESEQRLRDFVGFQLTGKLLEAAKPDAMVLHCLPAHRGEEISTAVFEQHADEIFDEAENRLHVQKAVLAILLAGK